MAANPPASGDSIISRRLADEQLVVPAAWRTKQFIIIGLLVLLAGWFAVAGYRSPAGDSGSADHFSPFDLVGFVSLGALAWFTTPVTWTIATTTFHEAIRRRWVTALLGFAVVMLGVSTFFTWMQVGSQQKFLRDYGLGFTVIMTLIAAIFLGVALIPPEIERRTVFTILSKPVTRLEFLLGKYLGLLFTLAMNLAVMSVIFLLSYAIFVIGKDGQAAFSGGNFFSNIAHIPQAISLAAQNDGSGASIKGLWFDLGNLAKALFLQYGTLSIMAAVAIMLSQFLSGIVAIIASFVVYFLGQSASYWEHLAGNTGYRSGSGPLLGPVLQRIVEVVYFLLPRLDRFDVRERIVNDIPVGMNYILKAGSSGCVYAAVLLTIAYFAWSDREF
jgi:Cu-processing system permease protein